MEKFDPKLKEKKQRIIDSALKLFTEYGFERTTTSAIAKETKINTATIFTIFKSKDNLIHELYIYCRDCIMNVIDVEYDVNSFEEHIVAVSQNIIDFTLENYVILKYIFLYYYSYYYSRQVSVDDKVSGINTIKEIFDKYSDMSHKDINFKFLTIYIIHYSLLVVDEIRKNEENEEKIRYESRKLLWNGISKYEDVY